MDVEHVRLGISTDPRIGDKFLRSGAGYGGSCLPKDVQALASMARSVGFEPMVLNAVERRNQVQKQWLFEKLVEEFGPDMKGRTIALWGLAFKPGTDDMREAPSITLVESLLKAGAQVRAYDPETKDTAPRVMPREAQENGDLVFVDDQYEAVQEADALVLVTEWPQFRSPDIRKLHKGMRGDLVVDGRNMYIPSKVRELGFRYVSVGRS